MASITTDIVDAYVFRHRQGRAQFLLLRRRPELPLGNTWHGIHGRVSDDETSLEAARRAVRIQTGLSSLVAFSADYINQFFDHATDTIVLAPVFAFQLPTTCLSRSTKNSTIMRGATATRPPGA